MNWGQIQAVVKQYLENEEPSFLANIPLHARLAEEDIYRKVQLPMTKETATSTLVIGDRFLSVPEDYVSAYSLAVITPTYDYLLPKDEAFLNEAYPDPTQVGKPRFYAVRNETDLLLAPTPGENYEVEMHYFKKPPSISLNNDPDNTNWLSENGENALIFGIIMHGYIYEKGDQDVIQAYGKQFEVAITDLKLIVEGRQRKDTYRMPDQRMPT
jgi:hypothetical protein